MLGVAEEFRSFYRWGIRNVSKRKKDIYERIVCPDYLLCSTLYHKIMQTDEKVKFSRLNFYSPCRESET